LPESIAVPCLSIIVPHLQDDAGLEVTLLSILENRDCDLEVIIAHDGSYADPYGLDQDEAVLIESPEGSSMTSQINLSAASACSPYIQVLMPGTTVDRDWFDEPIAMLDDSQCSAISVPVRDPQTGNALVGLLTESLPHRRLANASRENAMPLLCGGVFRKKAFNAMGGWLDHPLREVAEVELGLLIDALGLEVGVSTTVSVYAPKRVAAGQEPGFEIGRACGQLACAYASIEGSGVVIDSLARRLGHLASGLMSPKTVAERLGWVMGIRDRSLVSVVCNRLHDAEENLSERPSTIPMPHQTQSRRRAA
jgi:hypothetical protein